MLKKIKKLIVLVTLTSIVATLSGCYYDDKTVTHGDVKSYHDSSLDINITENVYTSDTGSTAYWLAIVKDYSGNRINGAIGQDAVGSTEDVQSMGNRKEAVLAINASAWDTELPASQANLTSIYKLGNTVYSVPGKFIYGDTLTLDNKGFLDFPAYYTNLAHRYYDSSDKAKSTYGVSDNDIASYNSGITNSEKIATTENYLKSRTSFPSNYVSSDSLKNNGVVATFNSIARPLYVKGDRINLSNLKYPNGGWKDDFIGIYYNRHPRTAIAQTQKKGENGSDHNEYIILVSDGRNVPIFDGSTTDPTAITKFSEGLTIPEVQNFLTSVAENSGKNIITAYNLDGGGSSQLYFKGHILNHPCGDTSNSKADADSSNESLRAVMDSIYFK